MESSKSEIDELAELLAARRAEPGVPVEAEQKLDLRHALAMGRQLPPVKDPTPEEREAWNKAREQQKQRQIHQRRASCWGAFIATRGKRYEAADFATYQMQHESAKPVIDAVKDYGQNIKDRCVAGVNLILFGPKGAGKDFIAAALVKEAVRNDIDVTWVNALDLYGEVRDNMGKDRSEREMLERYISAQVLYISDPVPPLVPAADQKSKGALTEFQAGILFRILDDRYSRKKPTWVTVNATGGQDLEQRMGAQLVDRLRDSALVCHCNWPSQRLPSQVVVAVKEQKQ